MPALKRSRKVLPLKPGGAGTTGRNGTIDFSAKAAIMTGQLATHDDHIYRVIELVGTSEESIEDAINTAVARASSTLRHLRWFEVLRTSGHIDRGAVKHYQVTLKVGFTMEDAA